MDSNAYIYFMTNRANTTLYIGVTHDLVRRVAEHKAGINQSFTARYKCKKLVYYEHGESILSAIKREKQLKSWKRVWKDELVSGFNPTWQDLSGVIGVTPELVEDIAANAEGYNASRDPGSSPG